MLHGFVSASNFDCFWHKQNGLLYSKIALQNSRNSCLTTLGMIKTGGDNCSQVRHSNVTTVFRLESSLSQPGISFAAAVVFCKLSPRGILLSTKQLNRNLCFAIEPNFVPQNGKHASLYAPCGGGLYRCVCLRSRKLGRRRNYSLVLETAGESDWWTELVGNSCVCFDKHEINTR